MAAQRKKFGRFTLSVAVGLTLAGTFGGTARAAGKDVEQASQVLRLNREALDLYESLEFELAAKSLQEALEVGARGGLHDHAVMARTHANLALVYGIGLKDEARALDHFKRTLEIRPDFRLPKDQATKPAQALFSRAMREHKSEAKARRTEAARGAEGEPTTAATKGGDDPALDALLSNAFKERKEERKEPATETPAAGGEARPARPAVASRAQNDGGAASGRGAGESESPASPAPNGALRCPSGGEVEAGDEITLRCVTSGELRPASVILFYKPSGREEFQAVPMQTNTAKVGSWSAKIPGDEVAGAWLPYYFEARGRGGERLALAGRDDSPNIITIRGGGPEAEVEAKPGKRRPPSRARVATEEDEENPLLEQDQRRRQADAGERRLWVGIGIGSGGGYAAGKGVEAYHQYVRGFTPGLAPAGLGHALPELGYFVTPRFALALQGRHQVIRRDNAYMATGAHAVLARALFFFGEGDARFYGALAAGGGEGFRLVIEAKTRDGTIVRDTVRGGPVIAGAALGFSYDLGETLAWIIEAGSLAGVPRFSLAFDVNTGLRFRF